MNDENQKLNLDKILCKTCNEINKIRLFSNYSKKTINVSFLCNHERNNEGKLQKGEYCLNCRKEVEQNKDCKISNHVIIQKEDIFFYCKTHMKKFSSYCEECEKIYVMNVYTFMKILKTNMNIIFLFLKLMNYYHYLMKSKIL